MTNKIKQIIKKVIWLFKEKEMIPIPYAVNADSLLDGKIALITGGSGGIGYAIAESFMKNGCSVILAGKSKEKLEKCCSDLQNVCTGRAKSIVIDVLDVKSIPERIEEAACLFDAGYIDILVNSAGVNVKHQFMETEESEYDNTMNINAKGTFFMCQAVAKHMIENQIKGHILNVTSASALRPAWTPYQMSKWALRGFTLGLADTLLPYGIIVNAIGPGPTATPMLGRDNGDSIYHPNCPSKRYAVPSEIGALATFMVSEYGNLIVGDTYYITGGSGTISSHY